MSLVTLEKYKQYLRITDTTLDDEINDLILAIETRVKEYLNQDIEYATYTDEVYSGNGTNELVLRNMPILGLTSIKEYQGLLSDNTQDWYTFVLGTDYQRALISPLSESIILDGRDFLEGMLNYKITYEAGYIDIPTDIQLACKELLKITYENSPLGKSRLGLLSVTDSAGRANENLSIDPEIEEKILKKIERYRKINV